MSRNTKAQFTGGTPFSGSQYKEMLDTRNAAMHGFAEGTIDATTKNAARGAVRNARKAIQNAGMTVADWREAEQARETAVAEAKASARKSRKSAKVTETEPKDEPVLQDA